MGHRGRYIGHIFLCFIKTSLSSIKCNGNGHYFNPWVNNMFKKIEGLSHFMKFKVSFYRCLFQPKYKLLQFTHKTILSTDISKTFQFLHIQSPNYHWERLIKHPFDEAPTQTVQPLSKQIKKDPTTRKTAFSSSQRPPVKVLLAAGKTISVGQCGRL